MIGALSVTEAYMAVVAVLVVVVPSVLAAGLALGFGLRWWDRRAERGADAVEDQLRLWAMGERS